VKMVPDPDGRNADFYRHAATGTLHLQRCRKCQHYYHPPRYLCRACGGDELDFVPSEGRGRIFSWTVTHRSVDPAWAEEIPYVTLVAAMQEGVRLVGSFRGDAASLELERPVRAQLDVVSEAFARIVFELAEA